MARTINQMSADRRSALRAVRKQLKEAVADCNRSLRRIDRILERRNKVPELKDLDALTVEYQAIQKEFDDYTQSISEAVGLFAFV